MNKLIGFVNFDWICGQFNIVRQRKNFFLLKFVLNISCDDENVGEGIALMLYSIPEGDV